MIEYFRKILHIQIQARNLAQIFPGANKKMKTDLIWFIK